MAPLIHGKNLSKSFGPKLLFKNLTLSLFAQDRVGLIGPNGAGKSTLLEILAKEEPSDEGEVIYQGELQVAVVPQDCEFEEKSPKEILIEAAKKKLPSYEISRLAETWLSRIGLEEESLSAPLLSGGWKKRLGIARALIREPDIVFYDEPTNHLDLESIEWFEVFLKKYSPTYLLISHDRYFLNHVTNKIIDLDPVYPKGLFSFDGSYGKFLEKKEAFLSGQIQKEAALSSKARREDKWLKSGVKARTTKARSRIEEAELLFEEKAELQKRNTSKKAKIDFSATERETRKLLSAKNLSKSLGEKLLFSNLDFVLSPGSRVGLMGPNGSGKTTLLKMIAGEMEPEVGTIKRAEGLQTVYFDQHRMQLPKEMSLKDALCPNGEYVLFRGREIHVNGWCKRFLFSPDLLSLPIEKLSGGERARIAIAHLMLQPADLLLLDEPTNDLDIPTLETLEETLLDFPGAICLITHDRFMLNRICNSFIHLGEKKELLKEKKKEPQKTKSTLSYQEKKEYEAIEGKIDLLEKELKEKERLLDSPKSDASLHEICGEIALLQNAIEALYLRFEELDLKKNTCYF